MTPENTVRAEVITYLRKQGHLVLPHRTEAGINPRTLKRMAFSDRFATLGESDLLVFHKSSPSSPVWVELKKKGKRSIDPDQRLFKSMVELWGHEYVVVNCVKDLELLGF